MPPPSWTAFATAPRLASELIFRVPALIATAPVNVLLAPSSSAPAPSFCNPTDPAMMLLTVVVPVAWAVVIAALPSVNVPPLTVYPSVSNWIPPFAVTPPASTVTVPAVPPNVTGFAAVNTVVAMLPATAVVQLEVVVSQVPLPPIPAVLPFASQ